MSTYILIFLAGSFVGSLLAMILFAWLVNHVLNSGYAPTQLRIRGREYRIEIKEVEKP